MPKFLNEAGLVTHLSESEYNALSQDERLEYELAKIDKTIELNPHSPKRIAELEKWRAYLIKQHDKGAIFKKSTGGVIND